jgi:hypothetical protein
MLKGGANLGQPKNLHELANTIVYKEQLGTWPPGLKLQKWNTRKFRA